MAAPTPIAAVLPITLGRFLKLAGLAGTGGESKLLITSGMVTVNGAVETRRGHKLAAGDLVEVEGHGALVRPRQRS